MQPKPDVSFAVRHIGLNTRDRDVMLAALGYSGLDKLTDAAIPAAVRDSAASQQAKALPEAATESEVAAELRALAAANPRRRSLIGLGYHETITPAVIRRNVLENPAWYTSYTPYQAEISQGRLEAMFVFQTVVADLTGLPIANSSLLDEPTAAAEAMALAYRVAKSQSHVFVVDADTHPQTLSVLATRARPVGIELRVVNPELMAETIAADGCFGALVSYPGSLGAIRAMDDVVSAAHAQDALVVACTDLLALTLMRPPGECAADIAVGSAQRLGVPMGCGGPHAAFMSVRSGLERAIPGRLVGLSVDDRGRPAYRLALQTREQHIRRERATSNICTAQVLLANAAAFYAAYHGPEGLRSIATEIHSKAVGLAADLDAGGVQIGSDWFFDTVVVIIPGAARAVVDSLAAVGIDVRLLDEDRLAVSVGEMTTASDLETVARAVRESGAGSGSSPQPGGQADTARWQWPVGLVRTTPYLTDERFHRYQSETEMMRWLRRLADMDLALDRGMIPLGSCTMKLNPTTAMESISLPGFADVHPFAPIDRLAGYQQLVATLEQWLADLTGYDAVSIQPNAGSQGELAGLLAIRAYLRERGESDRDICLIPTSAHGTNAASAAMAGLRVVAVGCDEHGGVDLADLRTKLASHPGRVAAVMITYPSTYGVYDESVTEVCDLVHASGGQVYVDGANLNALVGLARPGRFGADVSHLNLHKTFTVPHGGGGPGVGPVAVKAHLARYLPSQPGLPVGPESDAGVGPVSGAPWGNAGVLPIAYAYLRLMGDQGLRTASQAAVLAANYVAERLSHYYPVLYRGRAGLVAHECVLDLRALTKASGVSVEDVAKRLIDYGFHAPTVAFPLAGTLMVEPTESESLAELDRFCAAMIGIRAEIDQVIVGECSVADSPLRRSPHPAECLVEEWDRPYTRAQAVYPLDGMTAPSSAKYWPPVGRIDGAAGDRNLICRCI